MSKIEAIGFDLDGTLWDSTYALAKAWIRVAEADKRVKKVPQREDVKGIMGLTLDRIAERFFPELPLEEGMEIMEEHGIAEREAILEEGGILYPELEETLEELSREYKLFIVSNCHPGYIEAFLSYHKLEQYFFDHEDHGSTGLSKGQNIRLVMERNGISSCIYVGDTQGDYEASKEANVPFVHAAYGFGQVDAKIRSIEEFRDLPELMKKLGN